MLKILLALVKLALTSSGRQATHDHHNFEAIARILMVGASPTTFSSTSGAQRCTDFRRHFGRHASVFMRGGSGPSDRVLKPQKDKSVPWKPGEKHTSRSRRNLDVFPRNTNEGEVRRDPRDGNSYHRREWLRDEIPWEACDVSTDAQLTEKFAFVDQNAAVLGEFEIGEEVTGKVTGLEAYSVFLDIGAKKDVSLHVSRMGKEYCGTMVDNFKVGDLVECRVGSSSYGKELVSKNYGVGKPVAEFQLGQEVEGIIRAYPNRAGMVVDIGAEINAYLYIDDCEVQPGPDNSCESHPMDYFEIGDRIRARISTVNTQKPQIFLTCMRIPERRNWHRFWDVERPPELLPEDTVPKKDWTSGGDARFQGRVVFETTDAAQRALSLDGSSLGGDRIEVALDESSSQRLTRRAIVVRRLPQIISKQRLQEHFLSCGDCQADTYNVWDS